MRLNLNKNILFKRALGLLCLLTVFTNISIAEVVSEVSLDKEFESISGKNSKDIISDLVLIIEFSKVPNRVDFYKVRSILKNSKVERFDKYNSDYFRRLYKFSFKGKKEELKDLVSELMKLDQVSKVEKVFEVEMLSIKPNPSAPRLRNDVFFQYQWGLYNSGQVILKDLDDIHSERIYGKRGADIGWSPIRKDLDKLIKDDVIVAVLDSGLDLEHVDIQSNIYKNKTECKLRENDGVKKYTLQFRPKKDTDRNGYKGDCMGWNFTSKKKGGDHRPYDDVGHGTHVAGIVSAITSNGQGIGGVSNKIKVMPVKVLNKKEGPNARNKNGSLTDRIAKGILYAVKSKAKVINMSLGWPLSMDTEYLRRSIKTAIDKGVTIVAAAGNNNNSAPMYPCAYEGVICVGAASANGKFANFSNYGGYVDILAPGDNILSIYPKKYSPRFFAVKGYEIKNGTSQASPYIAGMAGIIKGVYPNISEDELKARLYSTARSGDFFGIEDEKYSMHGMAHLERSVKAEKDSVIRPIFKGLSDVVVAYGNKTFELPLKIKNYWSSANNIEVEVSFNNPNILLAEQVYRISELKDGETRELVLSGRIVDFKKDNGIFLTVKIKHNNEEQNYKAHLKVSRTLDGDPRVVTNVVDAGEYSSKLATIYKGKIQPRFKTVSDPLFQTNFPQYYIQKLVKEDPVEGSEEAPKILGIELIVFKKVNNKFDEISNKLFLPNAKKVVSMMVFDINYDGKLDYFVRSLVEKEDEKFIQYSYFDSNGKPLFEKNSHWKFTPEVAYLNVRSFSMIPIHVEGLGKIATPIFTMDGTKPKDSLDTDPWSDEDNSKRTHIYYLTPEFREGKVELKTSIIDDYKWENEVRKKLNLSWNDQINIFELLPQSKFSYRRGAAKCLVTVGKNFFTEAYILELNLDGNILLRKFYTKDVHLEGTLYLPVTKLGESNLFKSGLTFVGHHNETTVRLSYLDDLAQYPNYVMKHNVVYKRKSMRDHVLAVQASYVKDDVNYTFMQTKSKMIVHRYSEGEDEVILTKPITRFSFLPGQVFNESFYPIVKGIGENASPALYVDATQINRRDIYILTVDGDKLLSPIDYNVRVPQNCKSMNPVPYGENGQFAFTLLCQNKDKNWDLKFLKLK